MAAGPSEHGTQNMSYLRTLLNRKPARPHGGFAHDFATADGQRVISSGVDRLPERAGDTRIVRKYFNNPERSVVLGSACGYAG